jgi:hypothetical protein
MGSLKPIFTSPDLRFTSQFQIWKLILTQT